MYRVLISVALVCLSFLVQPAYAQSPLVPPVPLDKQSIPQIVEYFANQYQVSAEIMLSTMRCESKLKTNAVGDNGESFGISQINLPSHPEVTKEQAQNPVFASEFMAKEYSRGNAKIWTCYRLIYG